MCSDTKIACGVDSLCTDGVGDFVPTLICRDDDTSYIYSTVITDTTGPVKN